MRRGSLRTLSRQVFIGLVTTAIISTQMVPLANPALGANPLSPPFTECPAIGQAPTCNVLIVLAADGATVYDDPSAPLMDGSDDSMIGVVNESGAPVSAVTIDSTVAAFDPGSDRLSDRGYLRIRLGRSDQPQRRAGSLQLYPGRRPPAQI